MPVWISWTVMLAALLSLPVAWAALTRKLRPPAHVRGEPRDPPTQAFTKADMRARVEVISASASFAFAIAATVLIILALVCGGRVTVSELTWVYIAAGVFELVGILVTVDALIDSRQGMFWTPEHWAKWRGPAFIVGGIILGGLGNIESLHIQAIAPGPH
jgi:hypothetical protein